MFSKHPESGGEVAKYLIDDNALEAGAVNNQLDRATTLSLQLEGGNEAPLVRRSSSKLSTAEPFTEITRSPTSIPASAAALFGCTSPATGGVCA